jgi:hypothetical protein
MSENKTETLEVEILQPASLEAVTRAEVDIQVATAKRYPRSIDEFLKDAKAMATADEATAASCLYHLTRKDNKTGTVKTIEGPSVRMAEIVAASYGNMRIAVHITAQGPGQSTVQAVAFDAQRNVAVSIEKLVRTTYSGGKPYSDDMRIMAVNAGVSKARRDAVFCVVPRALVLPVQNAVKQIVAGDEKTMGAKRKTALDWLKTLKVDLARVWPVLGIKGPADIGIDQLIVLRGLWTAIEDGEQTVDEAFPRLEPTIPVTAPNFLTGPPRPGEEDFPPVVRQRASTGDSAAAMVAETANVPPPVEREIVAAAATPTVPAHTLQHQVEALFVGAGATFNDLVAVVGGAGGPLPHADTWASVEDITKEDCAFLLKSPKGLVQGFQHVAAERQAKTKKGELLI